MRHFKLLYYWLQLYRIYMTFTSKVNHLPRPTGKTCEMRAFVDILAWEKQRREEITDKIDKLGYSKKMY